jgi:hypothetical protein
MCVLHGLCFLKQAVFPASRRGGECALYTYIYMYLCISLNGVRVRTCRKGGLHHTYIHHTQDIFKVSCISPG